MRTSHLPMSPRGFVFSNTTAELMPSTSWMTHTRPKRLGVSMLPVSPIYFVPRIGLAQATCGERIGGTGTGSIVRARFAKAISFTFI